LNFKPALINRFPALASRDFNLFLGGQFISVVGTWMHNTAQPYLAYRISGHPFDLGLIGFATTLPTLLLALPAGVLVEHWDKRKTVIILQGVMSLQAFGLAALTFSGHIQIWQITLLAFLFGTASAIEITARQAMLIELAGRESLPSAIALQTTVFNLGRILGPLAAAWLMSLTGSEAIVFLANGISFIFVIIGLLMARTRYQVPREASGRKGVGEEFREGLSYIRRNSIVSSIILMTATIGFFGFPLLQQIPAMARDVLKMPGDTEASVVARTSQLFAAQGVGALVAALLAAYFNASRNKGRMVMFGQIAFLFSIIALGFAPSLGISLLLLVLVGWGTVTQLVTMNMLIQLQVPNGLRGRVFAVYLWAIQGVAPFGSLLIGGIAQTWGVPQAALTGGLVSLVIIAMLHLANPGVRRATA
jgi:MFS family permease